MKLKYKKIIFWSILSVIFLSISSIFLAKKAIEQTTNDQLYSSIDKIPSNKVGLLLGTSKNLRNGKINQYFENRIIATVQLFNSGKIKDVVISGDNHKKNYNEPEDMKNELIKRGIPKEHIYLDYAGFRTYDSVYRMRTIFGQTDFTIISQKFHNQRALYIANALQLKTIAFNAEEVNANYGFKTQLREKFARVKVFIDLLIDKKPKFLGEKVIIKD